MTDTADTPNDHPSGVPDGTVITTTHPDATTSEEKVVHDVDEAGNPTGAWHKEPVNG